MRIRPGQYRTIHVLKKALGLSDDEYREMLDKNFGVRSSVDLHTAHRADELIRVMRAQQGASIHGSGKTKYEHLGFRPGKANPAQMRMIEAMWADVSHHRDQAGRDKSLEEFLRSRLSLLSMLTLDKVDVQRVVKAIAAMKAQKAQKEKEAAVESHG